ncbi:hypothetical protein P879_09676 [Paragonimus westermani]|uniref:Protein kinase domain-containing protein n=1 Tax=Paragonimus westermani TaxID=34504 RepID=A0A8T0DD29_9TREM|nr:hypothetical protein P879_09676 [Paragonimus westermani]
MKSSGILEGTYALSYCLLSRRPYQQIGSDSYVAVCEEKSTKNISAVKVLQKKAVNVYKSRNIAVLLKLQHQNLVKLREVFESDVCLHIVLHLVEGEQLFERLASAPTYTEQIVASYFRQICEGLRCLHEYEIVHKNLKATVVMRKNENQNHSGQPLFWTLDTRNPVTEVWYDRVREQERSVDHSSSLEL